MSVHNKLDLNKILTLCAFLTFINNVMLSVLHNNNNKKKKIINYLGHLIKQIIILYVKYLYTDL